LGVAVASLDPVARCVTLADGSRLFADFIVIATGARARGLPTASSCDGVITVRDLDDCLRLKQALSNAKHLAVIGGGFIGAEVASSARQLGISATIFECEELPFLRLLGAQVARRLVDLHAAAGVAVKTGVRVEQVARVDNEFSLRLSDGSQHAADVVVAGLGAVPNTEFLAGSGVDVADGIICDASGRTSRAGVFAAGDVANWTPVGTWPRHRDEHWTSAREHARIVAHTICGLTGPAWAEYVPYFWSDMHGMRIQALGTPQFADDVQFVHDDVAKGAFLAEYHLSGRLIGVAACNAAGRLMKYRGRLVPVAVPSAISAVA
jgi:NADPH-dependent 2,4-dienoyl-CoA reductase/sulfur reductase-like enzyme